MGTSRKCGPARPAFAGLAEFGHDDLLDRAFHHEALGEVVHVLGGEAEVNPRVDRLVGLGADEVLDGLHVVIRRREASAPQFRAA